MKLTPQQYKEILTVALDHRLMYLKGKLLFDDRDPAIEEDRILRTVIDNYIEKNNINKLKKMLQSLIDSFFVFHDEYNFGQYLLNKTGYRIRQERKEHVSRSSRRSLHLSVTGEGDRSITTVQILLPTGSGVIYSVRGSFPEMKAEWRDNQTIEIEVPGTPKEFERVSQVKYHNEKILIVYKAR